LLVISLHTRRLSPRWIAVLPRSRITQRGGGAYLKRHL
jgi:hypothetical protein